MQFITIIKKIKSKFFLASVLIFILLFLSGCSGFVALTEDAQNKINNLRVIFLDVGQGDACLIITPQNKTILVDGGPDDKILAKLGQYLPLNKKKIDVMILTHPHADHLDGLVEVMKRYEVGEIYYSGVLHTTGAFLEWLKIIKDKNISLQIVKEKRVVELDTIKMDFLYPHQDFSILTSADFGKEEFKHLKLTNLNNASVVFKMIYGRTHFLFTGDAEEPVEKELLISGLDLKADILKIGHHGSKSSTSEDFLQTVNPQYGIISLGKDNYFGHPHLRTLRRLQRLNIEILRTDELSDIEFISDGEKIIKKPRRAKLLF